MMNLYLIRHGEIDRDGHSPDYFYRLTKDGNENASNMAKFVLDNCYDPIKDNKLVSSKTTRTIETALYLSHELFIPLDLIDNAHELDMGYNEAKPKKNWLYVDQDNQFVDRSGMSDNDRF